VPRATSETVPVAAPRAPMGVSRRLLRVWVAWTTSFLAFPFGGLAGGALAGRVDNPRAALIGGLATGLVVGAGQTLALALGGWQHKRLGWVLATGAGQAIGLLVGAAAVGYRIGLADLAVMGTLTGIPTGIAQAFALPASLRHRWAWAAPAPLLWGLGWTMTTLAGVDVEQQYTVFGATGALTYSALSGLVLVALWRLNTPNGPNRHPLPTQAAEGSEVN
jgi:hypothetical protein